MSPNLALDPSVETRTFDVTVRDLGLIDDWIERVGTRWHASERIVFGARLCVAELAANVFEHGVATSGRDQITVTLRHCTKGMGVEFVDSRTPFDPTRHVAAETATSVASLEVGGRGLRLLHAYAAELAYRNDGACNRVTFKVKSRV